MKRLLLCLLAVSLLTFVSCKKDDEEAKPIEQEQVNPAKDFEGDYVVSGTLIIDIPQALAALAGTDKLEQPIEEMNLNVALKGDKGDVKITVGEKTTEGYVNESGLHVDPIIVDYPILNTDVSFTVTIPVIAKPKDGVATCQASLVATAMGFTITGIADIVATKQ